MIFFQAEKLLDSVNLQGGQGTYGCFINAVRIFYADLPDGMKKPHAVMAHPAFGQEFN